MPFNNIKLFKKFTNLEFKIKGLKNSPQDYFAAGGGGERGIRTPDRVTPIHTFQARAFDRSASSPLKNFVTIAAEN